MHTLCKNPRGFFWAGDTAQQITSTAFRFADLKAFLFRLEVRNMFKLFTIFWKSLQEADQLVNSVDTATCPRTWGTTCPETGALPVQSSGGPSLNRWIPVFSTGIHQLIGPKTGPIHWTGLYLLSQQSITSWMVLDIPAEWHGIYQLDDPGYTCSRNMYQSIYLVYKSIPFREIPGYIIQFIYTLLYQYTMPMVFI